MQKLCRLRLNLQPEIFRFRLIWVIIQHEEKTKNTIENSLKIKYNDFDNDYKCFIFFSQFFSQGNILDIGITIKNTILRLPHISKFFNTVGILVLQRKKKGENVKRVN